MDRIRSTIRGDYSQPGLFSMASRCSLVGAAPSAVDSAGLQADPAERRLLPADQAGNRRSARFARRSKAAQRPGSSGTPRAKRCGGSPTPTATTSSTCGATSTTASRSYRDIDSDFNKKADQYRWFQTSGTRWGIDKNEDGRIDSWKVISAPEVAEELVWALKNSRPRAVRVAADHADGARRPRASAPSRPNGSTAELKAAPAAFAKLAADQKVVTPQSEFADFYRTRPATIPAGTEGSTKDVTIHDNASALVTTGDKHEQIYLGTLGPGRQHVEVDRRADDRRGQPAGGLIDSESWKTARRPPPDAARPVRRDAEMDGRLGTTRCSKRRRPPRANRAR